MANIHVAVVRNRTSNVCCVAGPDGNEATRSSVMQKNTLNPGYYPCDYKTSWELLGILINWRGGRGEGGGKDVELISGGLI